MCVCVCVCVCVRAHAHTHMLSHFSHVFVNPWTHQAPLSVVFSRQEYWSGLSCHPLGNHTILGIEPRSLMSPTLAGGFFTTSATWEAIYIYALKRFLRPGATWDYNEWHILKLLNYILGQAILSLQSSLRTLIRQFTIFEKITHLDLRHCLAMVRSSMKWCKNELTGLWKDSFIIASFMK